ncbi:insertion element IS1 protein InsB [Gammaproteobacteria bacterium]
MADRAVFCPCCKCGHVVKRGKTELGKQRYLCLKPECGRKIFILAYTYQWHLPEVKEQIIDMAMNGSGIRDTGRVLRISPGTVISEIRKQEPYIEPVNHLTLRTRIKRLARKIIFFSKLEKMHDIVIGLFINRYGFGVLVWEISNLSCHLCGENQKSPSPGGRGEKIALGGNLGYLNYGILPAISRSGTPA